MKVKIYILFTLLLSVFKFQPLHSADVKIWGPGLNPKIVLPARYFYVKYNQDKLNFEDFKISVSGKTKNNNPCRIWTNVLDRKDASFIIRYKLYEVCYDFSILVKDTKTPKIYLNNFYKGSIYPDECDCSKISIDKWLTDAQCKMNISQINTDLNRFKKIDFDNILENMVKLFNKNPHNMSVCQYVIKNNLIFRKCYGEFTGFKIFMDNLLLSLSRKVILPDLELFVNLGDWPLSSPKNNFPIFSWCNSYQTMDIVIPTYDITESSLENMGRVSLDMLSVQANIGIPWSKKIQKAFWMGRDSNKHRLSLIDISKTHPDLINASITNFFFYKDLKDQYGSGKKPISFFKFFDYKYQLNIDGTVAAYRFPYLLVGDSLVFKQESEYYEHFYNELKPWFHYIPVKRDLSDLVELIKVVINDDEMAKTISLNGQAYARENLAPHNIFGYYLLLFQKYSKLLTSTVKVRNDMDAVINPKSQITCECEEEARHIEDNIKIDL